MSKLASRRQRAGPITSTQVDGQNPGEEIMSREERIFQRQLESAIEASRKSAKDTVLSGSESSQDKKEDADHKQEKDNVPEKESEKISFKPKSRRIIDSDESSDNLDENSDDEFKGFETNKETKKVGYTKSPKAKIVTGSDLKLTIKIGKTSQETAEKAAEIECAPSSRKKARVRKLAELDSSDDDFNDNNETFGSDDEFVGFQPKKAKKSKDTKGIVKKSSGDKSRKENLHKPCKENEKVKSFVQDDTLDLDIKKPLTIESSDMSVDSSEKTTQVLGKY